MIEKDVWTYTPKRMGKVSASKYGPDSELYDKTRDYEKAFDEIIIVIPARKAKLWCMEMPSKYLL